MRPGAAAAARLRGPGPGAFLGAPGALPAAVRARTTCRSACRPRRRRCSTCCAGRCCAVVPQAADRHDAEEPAAPRAVGVGAGRPDAAAASSASSARSTSSPPPKVRARGVLQRQGLLRPAQGAPQARVCSDVAIVRVEQLYPFPREEYQPISTAIPTRGSRLVPGRAAEPGRLVPDPPSPAGLRSAQRTRCSTPAAPPAAAPATGIGKIHEIEQQALVAAALHSTATEESGATPRA